MSQSIVITGSGIVSAIGLDKESVYQSLLSRQSGIALPAILKTNHKDIPVGEVKMSNEEMKSLLNIDDLYVNRTTLLGMMAVDQAIAEARLAGISKKSCRVVLVSGTTVGGMDVTESYFSSMLTSEDHMKCMLTHDCGNSTRLLAERYNFIQDYTTVSTACSSAANAIMLAANLIKSGQADIAIAGGTEALSKFHLNGFNSLMILNKENCRPFDDTRAGLNLGEGAGFVVLESKETAIKRGADIQAYLAGYGNACDAYHQTASSPDGEGAYQAMSQALSMSGLKTGDIDYINAHGTGTPNNDESESAAIFRLFGDDVPAISSTKSFTGHTTSASGGIEAVICLLALQHSFLPANLGWSNQMTNGVTPTLGEENRELNHVMCNSFGFGGNDSSFILSKHETSYIPTTFADGEIKVVSRVEIESVAELSRIKEYLKPMEIRRMGPLMRSTLLSSLEALKQAGIERPDAIVTGTMLGCIDNSEKLLREMVATDEATTSPTLFMQSTHNTIGSAIAIQLGCHGYNTTYTQAEYSLDWCMRDAELLLRSGTAKTVLVGCHDENTEWYGWVQRAIGREVMPNIHSVAMVLTLAADK
ncbi:MAG: beta-ketoacyl-[acyl-carrier-protein] synthase family protein [Bacteroidales bacterium]|nr:beta-ketoacyl-[acyl-carrier-protein] synthase family protein [Bacteroidales bacterium]